MPVQAKPGVVKPEPHKGQEEVDLFIDLWHGVPDGQLVVAIVVVASLVKEGVQFALPDGVEPVGCDHILGHTRVSIPLRVCWWSVT